jgi:hypothetical protein
MLINIILVIGVIICLFLSICCHINFYKNNMAKTKKIKFISIENITFTSINGDLFYITSFIFACPAFSEINFFEKMNIFIIIFIIIFLVIFLLLVNEIIKLIIRKIVITADKKKTKL